MKPDDIIVRAMLYAEYESHPPPWVFIRKPQGIHIAHTVPRHAEAYIRFSNSELSSMQGVELTQQIESLKNGE